MRIEFTKMHGIGNDYIYVNCLQKELPDPAQAARAMSARRFSVGADGLVMICASDHAMNATEEMSALNRDLKQFFDAHGAAYPVWRTLERDAGEYLK